MFSGKSSSRKSILGLSVKLITSFKFPFAKYKTDDPNYYHKVPPGTSTPAYEDIVGNLLGDENTKYRCKQLYKEMFSPKKAVAQILDGLV